MFDGRDEKKNQSFFLGGVFCKHKHILSFRYLRKIR